MSIFKKTNTINKNKIYHLATHNIAKKNPLVNVLKEYGFKPYSFEDEKDGQTKKHQSEQAVHRDKDDNLQEIWIEQDSEGNTQYGYMHNGKNKHEHIYFDNLGDLVSHIAEEEEFDHPCKSGGECKCGGSCRHAAVDKKHKLNKPFRTPGGPKKFSVYVKNESGNVIKVNFGDPNMSIKRDQPDRRKNYRARHHCDNPGPKTKANYWSCKMWSKPSVTNILKGTKASENKEMKGEDPCWEGYEMIGKKNKNGKEVPNCVPKK
jgi:hypothetical protein